jgi:hypothetical protein
MSVLSLVQSNVAPGVELEKAEAGMVAPLQTTIFEGITIFGNGSTFTVTLAVLVQLTLVAVT